jgi:hypothetical protein
MATKWKPRRVQSEDERKVSGGKYIKLAEIGDKFLGYPIFDGDVTKDEPGYYEFFEHWLTAGKGQSVPCAGEDCPLCEDDVPVKRRANTLWWVVEDEKGDKPGEDGEGELRTWTINSIVIDSLADIRSDDKVMGRLFRVKRTDDRGNYSLLPKPDTLAKSVVKDLLKSDDVPDYEDQITKKLNRAMEGLAISRAVEDNDDDDDDEKPAAAKSKSNGGKKGKASGKAAKEKAKEEWPDTLEDVEVVVTDVEKKGNYFTAVTEEYEDSADIYTTEGIEFDFTDLAEGQLVTVSATKDDDGDYILDGEPEVAAAEGDEDGDDNLPDEINETEFEVVSVNADAQTLTLTDGEITFDLFFLDRGPASEIDFDDYKEGAKIIVSAEKDTSDDMVANVIPTVVKEKKAAAKKGGKKTAPAAKKGGKKAGKGK